jgi:NAD(P)-dependent dehydrogenase (short-subunit alcohol dehydrogenase family)
MNKNSNPKIVLITGCSSGFGLLTAARLASKGYKVIATMRNLKKQGALLSEVNRRGGAVEILELDVTNNKTIQKAIATIIEKYDRLDVLVNNAGYGVGGSFEDLTENDIRNQMETNFFGVQNVTRAVLPLMRRQKQGKIINISSVSGFSPLPFFSAYSASKWALEAFTESLRYELKFFGIDVCLIEPGTYKTPIFFENRKEAAHYNDPCSPYYEISQHLMKRVMENVHDCHKDPEEVAELIEKLIVANKTKLRNIPDLEGRILSRLRKILPYSLYSKMINKHCFKSFKFNANQSKFIESEFIS